MQVPRYTYLPLLIPEIRENLVELALDDQAFGETNEKDWWFEEDPPEEGEGDGGFAPQGPCKWYVSDGVRSFIFPPLVHKSSSSRSLTQTGWFKD